MKMSNAGYTLLSMKLESSGEPGIGSFAINSLGNFNM